MFACRKTTGILSFISGLQDYESRSSLIAASIPFRLDHCGAQHRCAESMHHLIGKCGEGGRLGLAHDTPVICSWSSRSGRHGSLADFLVPEARGKATDVP